MELLFGFGALLLLWAIAYGVSQSNARRQAKGITFPKEKVDHKG